MDVSQFIDHYIQNSKQIMWFLGAGTSRSAEMPTATDIIWNLKRRYYCLHENQDINKHDIGKAAVKKRIQDYMDSLGFPSLWSNEEYSFYFELIFGHDYAKQQSYLSKVLSSERISLNVGHRILAALISLGHTRLIFTTNFDEVIEMAYAEVSGKSISAFHLEGSYAALNALNSENYPIYAKIHGDFKYQSIKNLSQDLINNDTEIKKCFLAGADRYGVIISGYSGRDRNVMSMLESAMEQNNAFPHGLFWTVPQASSVEKPVIELIDKAKSKGIDAHIVETGTFDIMLSRIWRQVENKPENIDLKVKKSGVLPVSIPFGRPAKNFPLLRFNGLPIFGVPAKCGSLPSSGVNTYTDLKNKLMETNPNAVIAYTDNVLFWGDFSEAKKVCKHPDSSELGRFDFENGIYDYEGSTILRAFLDEAVANAIVEGKPYLFLRKRKGVYYVVVNKSHSTISVFSKIRSILGYKGKQGHITGSVTGVADTYWGEAVSVKLDFRDGKPWLLIRPDVWVTPMKNREAATDFLYKRKIRRYNNKTYELIDAWIEILFGQSAGKQNVTVTYKPDSEAPASFSIGLRTAYSGRGAI